MGAVGVRVGGCGGGGVGVGSADVAAVGGVVGPEGPARDSPAVMMPLEREVVRGMVGVVVRRGEGEVRRRLKVSQNEMERQGLSQGLTPGLG